MTYAAIRLGKRLPVIRNLNVGIEGERVVGQELEKLRADGWQVFHDIEGDGFNLDHVIVGKRGIFVIDTKARRKPKHGEAKVRFDGDKILVGGFAPVQAAAARRWLAERLKREGKAPFRVRSVILFPEWWVDSPPVKQCGDLWVLNPDGLRKFLPYEPEALLPSDVEPVATGLRDYFQYRRELREAKD